jgi:hypothetical protein
VKARIATIRRVRCRACAAEGNACEKYKAGQVNHADPAVACERGIWDLYHGEGGVAPPPNPPVPHLLPPASPEWFLAKWRTIHSLSLRDELTGDVLADLTRDIPGCCAGPWSRWLADNPLPIAGQFAWSVAAHNDVRQRQNKPLLTDVAARAEWTPLTAPTV